MNRQEIQLMASQFVLSHNIAEENRGFQWKWSVLRKHCSTANSWSQRCLSNHLRTALKMSFVIQKLREVSIGSRCELTLSLSVQGTALTAIGLHHTLHVQFNSLDQNFVFHHRQPNRQPGSHPFMSNNTILSFWSEHSYLGNSHWSKVI